jgi:MYXO-CTERM domain-containing protein
MALAVLFVAVAASAAVTATPVSDSSVYVLLGAGVLALVLLRRRIS